MRAREFTEALAPGAKQLLDLDKDRVIGLLKRDCADYIQAATALGNAPWLYRGMKANGIGSVNHGNSRQDRKPRDSSKWANDLFDWCLKKLGFTALRGNSIFCTSNQELASEYGELYMIFPIDKASSYTYTKYDDVIITGEVFVNVINDKKLERLRDQVNYIINHPDDYNDDPDLIRTANILKPGIRAVYGLMASSEGQEMLQDFQRKTGVSANMYDLVDVGKFEQEIHPSNSNLAAGLSLQREVLIAGEYYALRKDDWWGTIRKEVQEDP